MTYTASHTLLELFEVSL